jgi:hypothetical protein
MTDTPAGAELTSAPRQPEYCILVLKGRGSCRAFLADYLPPWFQPPC